MLLRLFKPATRHITAAPTQNIAPTQKAHPVRYRTRTRTSATMPSIKYPIVSPFAANWHIGELGGGNQGGSKGRGSGGGANRFTSNRFRFNACGALPGAELAVAARFVLLSHTGAMHDEVHLLGLILNDTEAYVCCDSATTVKYFAFSLSDLKTSIDAPRRELTLHTTFGKNAKGLDRLSEVTPRWIIELSTRQWRNQVW